MQLSFESYKHLRKTTRKKLRFILSVRLSVDLHWTKRPPLEGLSEKFVLEAATTTDHWNVIWLHSEENINTSYEDLKTVVIIAYEFILSSRRKFLKIYRDSRICNLYKNIFQTMYIDELVAGHMTQPDSPKK